MLNELYRMSSNLKKCGIQLGDLHQNIKTPGKAAGFIVGIDENGKPKTVEHIIASDMHKLWTLRKGQHNSFPYIKLKKPILDVKFDDPMYEKFKSKKTGQEKKLVLLTDATQNYDCNKQDLSLAEWTQSQIAEVAGKDQKLTALVDLAKRLPKNEESSKNFLKNLSVLLIENLNELTVDLITTLIVGDRKERKIVCDVSLFFDVSDWAQYLYRVAHPEMGLLVSKYLPKAAVSSKKDGISAFGGSGLHMGPYPDPNLPLIGRIYLFSMNEDAPCHYRYGKIGSAIFPASLEEVQAMHGVVEWCVDGKRKGKTWQGVPNVKRKQDLLISYLEEKPENAIELASVFAAPDVKESETAEAVYENKTKTVCDALRGEPGLKDSSQVNVFVISKVDEGRAQVVLSAAYSVKNIIQSVEEWRTASNNRPPFSLWLPPPKKGEKAQQVEPSCPSPVDVMRCLQNQWIKNGLDRRDVPGLYLRHVYDLFLGDTFIARQAANHFLNLSLQRLGDLLIGYGGADHADVIKEYSADARKTVLYGISVLVIALYKLGIRKEDYMRNVAFNVGRMLALADKLHEQYCRHVRKKEVPPQMIGNALMHTALDNPTKGLSLLSERLLIYQAWATKAQGENVGLAKWVLGQMGQVSADLENVAIPTQADDAVKAQILLGYLAHIKNENQ